MIRSIFRPRCSLAFALAPLILTGCSAGFDPGLLEGITDREPVTFRAPAPQSFAVRGVDVAWYQGEIDWPRLKENGIAFAFIKATEGADHLDRNFMRNWHGARAAGIPTGAYHFYYFCRTAREQAEWFIRNVPRSENALPPVLDMEWNGHSETCPIRVPREKALQEMRVFLRIMERHYGQKPIIYSTVDFQDGVLKDEFNDYDHWLRSVARHVEDVHPTRDWRFWQYTATGRVPGVDHNIDLNVFDGSKRQWRRWLRKRVR